MGPEQINLGQIRPRLPAQRMSFSSFFQEVLNPEFQSQFRGLSGQPNRPLISLRRRRFRANAPESAFYSAAPGSEDFTATSTGLVLAADAMKSLMRGTISDLKREPLKTP